VPGTFQTPNNFLIPTIHNVFILQNIAVTFQNIFKLQASIKKNCSKINIFNSPKKKILDEKCLFIALSFYPFIAKL